MTLREWRGKMPRTTLAPLLGVSKSTLKRWENGTSRIPHIVLLLTGLLTPDQLKGKP